jgi:CspA family cold shock protein
MPIGTVKFFNNSKGYGFIAPDQAGNDAFVHITALERAGMRTLRENERLSYDLEQDQRGRTSAVNLRRADGTDQSPPQQMAEQLAESELAAADVREPVHQ